MIIKGDARSSDYSSYEIRYQGSCLHRPGSLTKGSAGKQLLCNKAFPSNSRLLANYWAKSIRKSFSMIKKRVLPASEGRVQPQALTLDSM